MSASESREDILHALEAGVHGYIVKSQHTDQLIVRLRYILSGEIYVPPSLAEQQPVPDRAQREIAKGLNVAEGTVKMHLAALYRALGATNRAHAAALGRQLIA